MFNFFLYIISRVQSRTISVSKMNTYLFFSMYIYLIRTLVFLYNSIDRNWSIFFDIGCVKIHVKWYRVCKQNRTSFVLLLFTMMTLRTQTPIIPAFLWRHNVFIYFNFNLSSSWPCFTQSIYICPCKCYWNHFTLSI